jgi:glycosyltransferase involved in cell wall biosynthesis
MPSYNQGQFIEAAIRSILLQEYPDLELIVVDGDSHDRTREVVKRYEAWVDHLVWEEDGGAAHALNKGFRLATGQILAFLNADDFYLPGGLVNVVREFRACPAADVVSGNGYLATPAGTLGPPLFSDGWHPGRAARGTCKLVQPATLFRRGPFERAGGFNERNRTCWDFELWADMARVDASFHSLDYMVAAYRIHPDSISAKLNSLRAQRRTDVDAIFQKLRGRSRVPSDHVWELLYRGRRFCSHPRLSLRQRAFLHRTLGLWSWPG